VNKNKYRKTYILVGLALVGFMLFQIIDTEPVDHKQIIATYYNDNFGDTIDGSNISDPFSHNGGKIRVNVAFKRDGQPVIDRVIMSSDGSKVLSIENTKK
jgi:hypothetical protein